MSDFARDYDEFKCTLCGKEYQSVIDRKYCNECAKIVYADRIKRYNLFGKEIGGKK